MPQTYSQPFYSRTSDVYNLELLLTDSDGGSSIRDVKSINLSIYFQDSHIGLIIVIFMHLVNPLPFPSPFSAFVTDLYSK